MAASLMDLIHQAGFQGNAAQIMYAIVMAESGGNASAHNTNAGTGDNSYGLAQINMLGNMGPERLKAFGLTSNDQLFDPLTNLRVAYKMSGGGTKWGDWSTYNSGAYKPFLGQSGAAVTSNGATQSASGGVPAMTNADYAQALGSLGSLLTTVPELKGILQKAVAGGWAVSKFQQAIQQTSWYRTHNDAARNLIALKASNPAQYAIQVQQARNSIQNLANQLGVGLNAHQLDSLVSQFMVQGWDQGTLTTQIGKQLNAGDLKTPLKGQNAANYQTVKQLYADYGVPVSESALHHISQALTEGVATVDTYKQQVINLAKSMYPSLAGQLDTGLTVKTIADPYVQQMSNLLELDPNNIGITDPLIKKALQGTVTTAGGKSTSTTTPLYQFEQTLRNDPRWTKTQNATDTISTALVSVGKDFGFAA